MTYQYIPFMAKIIRAQRAKKTSVRSLPKKAAKVAKAARPARKSKAPKPKVPKPKAPKPWTPQEVREVFERFRKANPEPRGELEHLNPFTLLVAVVLSAQATDAGVNKATPALFAAADTPEKMVALGEARVRDFIKTIGLFNTKAKNVIALSEKLIAEHGGMVPPLREALEALPGVGRKTANVVLNVVFGAPTIAVDTHVQRVANRLGLARTANPEQTEQVLLARTPERHLRHAHHYLILHGRYTCVARTPRCPGCPVRALCRFPDKTEAEH